MDNQNIVYMAYDGDNAGRLCGRAILADNPDALHEISARINLGHEVVRRWVEARGGKFISGGGDEGVFSIPADSLSDIEALRADYEFATNLTATIGVGNTLSEAGKAMLVGKFKGKNQVVKYDPSLEETIKQAQARMTEGTASAEEKKIGEAYLQTEGQTMANSEDKSGSAPHDCEYCRAMDAGQSNDLDHCRYCHDSETLSEPCQYCDAASGAHDPNAEGHTDDCQYCREMHNPSEENHPSDCKYCQEAGQRGVGDSPSGTGGEISPTAGPTVVNPTTTDSQNYAGQDLNNPDTPKPPAIQPNPDGLGTSFDTPTVENTIQDVQGPAGSGQPGVNEEGTPDPQAEETIQDIAQQIDELPPAAQLPSETEVQIDPANMATGTAMEDGTSRPDDYADENTPRDMGLAEDEQGEEIPDVTSLMQEGLNSHADDIAKEKVVNLVSEALMGFKASKGILEKAKLQAPQLYESSIAMLKAMIEMCKLLGLDQTGGGDSEGPIGSQGDQVVNELQGQGQDQPAEGSAPPAQAHTGEQQNPPQDNIPVYQKKEDNPAKKQKGQLASQ